MILVSPCCCLSPIHSSLVLSREWRCSWSSADRRCSNYIWVINNFSAYEGASYIRGFTLHQNTDITGMSPECHDIWNHQELNYFTQQLFQVKNLERQALITNFSAKTAASWRIFSNMIAGLLTAVMVSSFPLFLWIKFYRLNRELNHLQNKKLNDYPLLNLPLPLTSLSSTCSLIWLFGPLNLRL